MGEVFTDFLKLFQLDCSKPRFNVMTFLNKILLLIKPNSIMLNQSLLLAGKTKRVEILT